MSDRNIPILCYTDDAFVIAENEDDLQRLLQQFNTISKTYNITTSINKTKCRTTSKRLIRCRIVIDDQIIQQEMKF